MLALLLELGRRKVVEGAAAPSGVVVGQPLEDLQSRLVHRVEQPLVLRASVRVEDHSGDAAASGRDRHRQGVDDQLRAHV
ncbi:hypothetical protein [Streptomyces sp. NPDC059176]|uniref:hypothetical protein n=1 Tax=Streptomyces sp. NPDC059176 TaxID=3346758 RepID=UPI0036C6F226